MSVEARLRWRCRRGMRELDALMLAWLDTHYGSADDSTRTKFEALLEMQDPDIMTLLKKFDTLEAKDFDDHSVNRGANHGANHPESSKDSSFETIIRQARQAAARQAARQATSAKN